MELRFPLSAVPETAAGVGVGVGEPSDVVATGGGLDAPDETLTLSTAETGDSLDVPLVAASAAWMLTFDS